MAHGLQVLLLEDNRSDAELILCELEQNGFAPQLRIGQTKQAFIAALDPEPDLIIADLSLPQFGGLEALEWLQAKGLKMPLILVSGISQEDLTIRSLGCGAADTVSKEHLEQLGPAIRRLIQEGLVRR